MATENLQTILHHFIERFAIFSIIFVFKTAKHC